MRGRDPFALLGLRRGASPSDLRRAFRRLALALHPDRNPNDPRAHERLRRVIRAYEEALARTLGRAARGGRDADRTPPPRPRFRWECLRCGDSFALGGQCPRCALELVDGWAAAARPAPPPEPAVEALVARLEARLAREGPSRLEPLSPYLPGSGAALFVGASAFMAHIELWGVAAYFLAFGGLVGLREVHARLRGLPVWAR